MPTEPTLLRVLITGRHWQRFETFSAQFARAAQRLAEIEGEPGIGQLSVSARQFERWYAGRIKSAPRPDSCRVLEHMFGYPIAQLLTSESQVSVTTESAPLGQDGLSGVGVRRGQAATGAANSSPTWAACDYVEKFATHETPRLAFDDSYPSPHDSERIISMAARRALRFGAMADATNIGSDSLDQLHSETGRLAIAYLRQPLAEILGDIASLQDHTFSLLEGRQRPRETQDLYVVGGLTSGMLAKAAHDLRDPHLAMTHARTAMLCARNADHSALLAWVHGLQSLITYWADRPREALEYAQAGQEITGVVGTVGVWLASLEARAWSALGNGAESRRAIERAADMREQVTGDDLDSIGGMCRFSRPRQLYYAADAGISLPGAAGTAQDSRSAQYAADAIAAYESAPDADRSFSDEAGSRTALAISRVRAGDIEGASEAVAPVLQLPHGQRIHGIVTSVVNVHHEIAALASEAALAADLQEEIEAYCRTPAAALPR